MTAKEFSVFSSLHLCVTSTAMRLPFGIPCHRRNSQPDGVHRFCWFTSYPPTVFPEINIVYFFASIVFRAVAILERQRAGYPLHYSAWLFLPTSKRTQTSELLSEMLWKPPEEAVHLYTPASPVLFSLSQHSHVASLISTAVSAIVCVLLWGPEQPCLHHTAHLAPHTSCSDILPWHPPYLGCLPCSCDGFQGSSDL